jgi:DNA-directed RNA polymerase specialized sigma24 family protein
MPRTFEELATPELDALYQGALFLSAGEPTEAENLVVEAVTLAFREHASIERIEDVQRWFEARLVRSFLRTVQDGPVESPHSQVITNGVDPAAFDGLGSQDLYAAAAAIPILPRAALWLTLLRRWSYSDAAAVLSVEESEMPTLLAWRDTLMHALIAPARPGDRAAEMS